MHLQTAYFVPGLIICQSYVGPPVQQLVDVAVPILGPDDKSVSSQELASSKPLTILAIITTKHGEVTVIIDLNNKKGHFN